METLMSKCTATSKRTGEPCRAQAMRGKHLCYHHGGKTPTGVEAPVYKHGRYSGELPTRLIARYNAAQIDPNILDQRAEIAVLQSRLSELLQRIDEAEAGHWFKRLNKARTRFLAAGTVDKKRERLDTLLLLIEQGADAWMIWDDIARTMEQHRRLVADQVKSDQAADLLISLEKLMLIFGVIREQIHAHVPSRDARAAIAAGLDPIFSDLIPGYTGRGGDA